MSSLKGTKHFRERWAERIGGCPDEKAISREISGPDAIRLQRYRELFTTRGYRHIVLAIYWLPGMGIAVKIDERNETIVTVLGRKTRKEQNADNHDEHQ